MRTAFFARRRPGVRGLPDTRARASAGDPPHSAPFAKPHPAAALMAKKRSAQAAAAASKDDDTFLPLVDGASARGEARVPSGEATPSGSGGEELSKVVYIG